MEQVVSFHLSVILDVEIDRGVDRHDESEYAAMARHLGHGTVRCRSQDEQGLRPGEPAAVAQSPPGHGRQSLRLPVDGSRPVQGREPRRGHVGSARNPREVRRRSFSTLHNVVDSDQRGRNDASGKKNDDLHLDIGTDGLRLAVATL